MTRLYQVNFSRTLFYLASFSMSLFYLTNFSMTILSAELMAWFYLASFFVT
jgi:hypothetical protein